MKPTDADTPPTNEPEGAAEAPTPPPAPRRHPAAWVGGALALLLVGLDPSPLASGLFVGELLERKGLTVLMDALDLLDAAGTSYELVIVGDDTPGRDPDKDAMVQRIRDRGRGGDLTGAITRDQVYEMFSGADVFVLPTEYEGQPFTVIESLAAGVPVVASDIPAIRSMVADGDNGRLVPWNDPPALASALTDLLADPTERARISTVNRESARERFDRSVFREELARLYRASARHRRR